MKMKTRQTLLARATAVLSLAAALSGLSLLSAASPAEAAGTDCITLIRALRADTVTVAISGRKAEMDRAGLLWKLDNAVVKLGQDKPADAILKLTDYAAKVQQLGWAGRMSGEDVARLLGQVQAAIRCIEGATP